MFCMCKCVTRYVYAVLYHSRYAHSTYIAFENAQMLGRLYYRGFVLNSFDFRTIFQTEEYVPTVLNCRKKFSKLNFRVRVLPMVSKRRTVWYTPCPL